MIGPIGTAEVFLILVLALLLFGPRKLPELGRMLGRTVTQLRRAATDFRMDLEREIEVDELRKTREEVGSVERQISGAVSEVRNAVSGAPPAARGSERPPAFRPGPLSPPDGREERPAAADPAVEALPEKRD